MVMVIPKWQVDVVLSNGHVRSVWIADSFIENVLRQVATMSFDASPLVRATKITVWQGAGIPQAVNAVCTPGPLTNPAG